MLKQYGVEMHLPAVAAEVCIAEGVSKTLHDMLLTLREIKQGMQKGKIKFSAAALPRIEPWLQIIAKTPTPLRIESPRAIVNIIGMIFKNYRLSLAAPSRGPFV